MENKTSFYSYLFSCFAIFALIYYPAFFIPFHSDDYSYFMRGLSLQKHIDWYIGTSGIGNGRFIVNYLCSTMVVLFSKPVYIAINSLTFLIVLINISIIPSILAKEKCTALLWASFFLYWLYNPNL